MICDFCGLETGRKDNHATQQECRAALRIRVSELAREVNGLLEAKLCLGDGVPEIYEELSRELQVFKRRLLAADQIIESIKTAKRFGSKRAWAEVMDNLDSWCGPDEASSTDER